MAGEDFTFNIVKGKVAYIVENIVKGTAFAGIGGSPVGRLILVLLINDGAITLEADDDMKDRDTLADVLSGSTEANTTGSPAGAQVDNYARIYMTGASDSQLGASQSDALDEMDVDISDKTWSALGSGAHQHVIGKLLVCFDAYHTNTTAGTEIDSQVIPLTAHSFDVTPDGSDISALVTNFQRTIDG